MILHNKKGTGFIHIVLLAFSMIIVLSSRVFATPAATINVKSLVGEKFFAELLIDTKKDIIVEVGSALDYKLLKVTPPPPRLLDTLYISLPPNLYKDNRRVVYILSKKPITLSGFPLILKFFLYGKEPSIKKLDVTLLTKQKGRGSNRRKNIALSLSGRYRTITRDMTISGKTISSKTTLSLFRSEFSVSKRIGVFFDLGSGILKLEDPLLFDTLTIPVNIQKYDGGRGIAYGGGVKGKLFERYHLVLDMTAHVKRFSNSAETTDLKIVNSKAEAVWMEYGGDLTITYNKFFLLQPYVGTSYSAIDGDFTVTQTAGSTSSKKTVDIEEKDSIGILIGLKINPLKQISIIGEGRLIQETGFTFTLQWTFQEI